MKRRALLLVLGLALAGCGRHHGNIISISNTQGFTPLDNEAAPANGNASGNEQNAAAARR
jgi:hypothetical protein